jgi:hypothetical protein
MATSRAPAAANLMNLVISLTEATIPRVGLDIVEASYPACLYDFDRSLVIYFCPGCHTLLGREK